MIEGLYLYPRGQNIHTFAQIKKDGRKKDYNVTIVFKSKISHKEMWSEKDIKTMIKEKKIKKAEKLSW